MGGRGGAGNDARTVWLLGLSLLVCLVGISNAMLMSVMERFREIGTMKCLGALDSFILKLFFLESIFLGAAGSAGGVAVGSMLALLQLWRQFGGSAWSGMPWGRLLVIAMASTAIGLTITAAAALYPAYRAAQDGTDRGHARGSVRSPGLESRLSLTARGAFQDGADGLVQMDAFDGFAHQGGDGEDGQSVARAVRGVRRSGWYR